MAHPQSRTTAVDVLGALSTGVLPAARAAAPTISAELLTTTKTSEWRSPSPDPTRLTLIRSTNRLIVSDAEVDEIPGLWKGGNLFTASRRGVLIRRGSVLRATPEPEDVAWHGASRSLYIVDEDRDAVSRIRAGHDGRIGTSDGRSRAILRTRSFGSGDPEGLAWRSRGRTLIVTDARRAVPSPFELAGTAGSAHPTTSRTRSPPLRWGSRSPKTSSSIHDLVISSSSVALRMSSPRRPCGGV